MSKEKSETTTQEIEGIKNLEERIGNLENEQKEFEGRMVEYSKKISKKVTTEISDLLNKIGELQSSNFSSVKDLENKLEDLKNNYIKEELNEKRQKINYLEDILRDKEVKLRDLEIEKTLKISLIEKQEADISLLESKKTEFKEENQELKQSLGRKEEEIKSLKGKIITLEKEIETLEKESLDGEQRINIYTKKLEDTKTKLENSEVKLEELKDEIENLKGEKMNLKDRLEDLEIDLNKKETLIESLREELIQKEASLANLQERFDENTENLSSSNKEKEKMEKFVKYVNSKIKEPYEKLLSAIEDNSKEREIKNYFSMSLDSELENYLVLYGLNVDFNIARTFQKFYAERKEKMKDEDFKIIEEINKIYEKEKPWGILYAKDNGNYDFNLVRDQKSSQVFKKFTAMYSPAFRSDEYKAPIKGIVDGE